MWSTTLRHNTRHLHVATRSALIRRLHTSTVCRSSLFSWFTSRKSKPPPPVSPEDQFLDIFEEEPIDTKSPSYRFAQRMKAKLEKKEEKRGGEGQGQGEEEKTSSQQPQQSPSNQQQRPFTTHEARIRHAVNEMKQRQQQQQQTISTFTDLDADHFEVQAMTLAKQVLKKLEQEQQQAEFVTRATTATTPISTSTPIPTPIPTSTPTPIPTAAPTPTPTSTSTSTQSQSARSNIPPPPPPPPLTPMPTTNARVSPTTSTSPSFFAINRAVRAMTGGIRPPDHTTHYTHQSTTTSAAKDEPVNWNSPLAPPLPSTSPSTTSTATSPETSTVTPFDMTEFLDTPVKPAVTTTSTTKRTSVDTATATATPTLTPTPTPTPAPSATAPESATATTWFDGLTDTAKPESTSEYVPPIPSVDAVLDMNPRIAAERVTEAIQTATTSRLSLLNYASELVTMAAKGYDPQHLHTSTSSATNMSSRIYSHPHVISCATWTCQCSTCIGKLELSHDTSHTITCYYSLNDIQQSMDETSIVIQIRPIQPQKQGMTLVIPWKEFSARFAPALSTFPYPSLRISTTPSPSFDPIPSTSTCTHRCNLTHILRSMSDDTHSMDELPSHVQTLFYTWIQERGIGNKSKDVILSDLISLHATLTSHALSPSSRIPSESSLISAWAACLTQYHDINHAYQILHDFFSNDGIQQDTSHIIPTLLIPLMNELPDIQKDENVTQAMITNEDDVDVDENDDDDEENVYNDDENDAPSIMQKILNEEKDERLASRYPIDVDDGEDVMDVDLEDVLYAADDERIILNAIDEINEVIEDEFNEMEDEMDDEEDEDEDDAEIDVYIDENDQDEDEDESDWSDSESENESEDENQNEDEYSDSDSE